MYCILKTSDFIGRKVSLWQNVTQPRIRDPNKLGEIVMLKERERERMKDRKQKKSERNDG